MAKHARSRSEEQVERLRRNRETMLEVIAGNSPDGGPSTQTSGTKLELERFVHDRASGQPVPFEGSRGVERILAELARSYPGGEEVREGHLVAVGGILLIDGHDEPVALRASVGAGAQLALEVGPVTSLAAITDALAVFSRQFHLACRAIGRDCELVAQGLDPAVSSPSDIVLVPRSRYVLMNTYLARTGYYARDMMRCSASTRVRLPMAEEEVAAEDYRLLTALAPVLAFLTDNTLSVRGSDPTGTPRMARQLVWDGVDPTRCGFVPGSLSERFGFAAYERWVEGVRPILFSSDDGVTFSCGIDTCEQVMCERELSAAEARHLLSMAFPYVRWDGTLELRVADALSPRMAVAYVALVRGLLATDLTRRALRDLLMPGATDEDAIADAWRDLRAHGWDARVYGRPIAQVADELSAIASRGTDDRDDRRMLEPLTQLWDVRMVPRDLLERSWRKAQGPSSVELAVELYGEGAVIPYDELAGEPPAGSTSVMRFD